MSKKRRTRAQKARAAERRQHEIEEIVQPAPPLPVAKASTAKPIPAQPVAAPAAKPTLSNRRDLRGSLVIFGGLIAAQVLIWLLFRLTSLDDQLYNLIKL